MILNTIELTGNEPTYEQLLQRIDNREFSDILATRSFLILTVDAGLVKVNTDGSITTNIAINTEDVVSKEFLEERLKALTEDLQNTVSVALQDHQTSYHSDAI